METSNGSHFIAWFILHNFKVQPLHPPSWFTGSRKCSSMLLIHKVSSYAENLLDEEVKGCHKDKIYTYIHYKNGVYPFGKYFYNEFLPLNIVIQFALSLQGAHNLVINLCKVHTIASRYNFVKVVYMQVYNLHDGCKVVQDGCN